jgi:hypothetical protein
MQRPGCLSLQRKDTYFQQCSLYQYGDFTQIYTPAFALNIWTSLKSSKLWIKCSPRNKVNLANDMSLHKQLSTETKHTRKHARTLLLSLRTNQPANHGVSNKPLIIYQQRYIIPWRQLSNRALNNISFKTATMLIENRKSNSQFIHVRNSGTWAQIIYDHMIEWR